MIVVPIGRTDKGAVDVYSKTSPGFKIGVRPVTPSPCTTSFMDEPTVWISNRRPNNWMVSVGELFVIRMVYWKQCFRIGGSDCSLLYTDDTSTVSGPVTVLDDGSTGISISPPVTSSSPGRRGRPPAASAAAASRALAALPPALAPTPVMSSSPSSLSVLTLSMGLSSALPSCFRRIFFISSRASWRAFSIDLVRDSGVSGNLPRISLARSRFFFWSSSISPINLRMVRSRRSFASLSSRRPGLRMSSSYCCCSFSMFFRRSAIMARPRAARSARISPSNILEARLAEMPMS
mmetsp:Transcript_54679/g.132790  ORF Transcript_54679/g.132790 Transcript_54679/m.132790 type:complete len:292 (-) Transcript_54679:949-1824(-)